jgi:hypothetical protein
MAGIDIGRGLFGLVFSGIRVRVIVWLPRLCSAAWLGYVWLGWSRIMLVALLGTERTGAWMYALRKILTGWGII